MDALGAERRTWRSLWCAGAVAAHAFVLLVAVAPALYASANAIICAIQSPARRAAASVQLAVWPHLLANTARVGVVAVGVSLATGTLLALLLARSDLGGRRVLLALLLLLACLPIYVSATFIFAAVPIYALASSAWACGVLYGLLYTPLVTLVLGAVLAAADGAREELALLDASPGRVIRCVTLPGARGGLAAAGVLVLLLVTTDCTLTDLLVVRTFAEEVYAQFQLDPRRVGPILTAMPPALVLAGLLALLHRRLAPRNDPAGGAGHISARIYRLGRWRRLATVSTWLIVGLVGGTLLGALLRRIDHPFAAPVDLWALRGDVLRSIALTLPASAAMVAVGVGMAWYLVHARRAGAWFGAILVLLLALPAPLVGAGAVGLWNHPGPAGWVYDSPLIVVLTYISRFLPVAILLLVPAVRAVPAALVDAARVEGCDALRVQWHVVWPSIPRAAPITALVLLVLCLGEIGATMLVVPPQWPLVSGRAYLLLHSGVYQDLALLALLAAAMTLLPWWALWMLLRRTGALRVAS